MKNMNI